MRAVLERDFLFQASRGRAVVLRTVIAAVVSAVACLAFWIGMDQLDIAADQIGEVVFVSGAIALLVLLALLTPPLVVGSVLEERQDDTLLLVLATPIGCRSFAAAKLLSRWGVSLLVAFAALPALAMAPLFGGVSGTQLAGLVVTALALSLEMAAWSLWISAASRRLATAVILSYVLPLARWAGTGFLLAWFEFAARYRGIGAGATAAAALAATFPVGSAASVATGGSIGRMAGGAPPPAGWFGGLLHEQPWWFYLAFSLLLAGAAVVAAGARLRIEAEPRDSLLGRTKRGRRWFRGSPPAGNPVVWKERRLLNTSSSRPLFYGVLGLLLLILGLGIDGVRDDDGAPVIIAAMLTLISLVAAVQGAAAIGQERTQGGYDLLRASLLTPGQIVAGKLAGVFTGTGFLAAVPVCAGLLASWTGAVGPGPLVGILAATALFPGAWALLGMWIGVRAPTPRAAVVRTVALFGILLVGFPLAAGILEVSRVAEDEIVAFLAMASPPATSWAWMEFARGDGIGDAEGAGLFWTAAWLMTAVVARLLLPRRLARQMDEERGPGV